MHKIVALLLVFLMFGGILSTTNASLDHAALAQGEPIPASISATPGGPDLYGYLWDDAATWDWKEFDGTQLFPITPGLEQRYGVIGPVDLGFDFKFYEQTYSQIYISVEGLLSFDPTLKEISNYPHATNLQMPSDVLPHALIAPFWENLTVPVTGTVAYTANSQYFAVQWANVTTSLTSTIPITFQVVLYADSYNIGFYYESMQPGYDSASIGIEDRDGVDGLLYRYNSPGLIDHSAILFIRPGLDHRVKMLPLDQSKLTVDNLSTYLIYVRNSGDFPETYTLQVAESGWGAVAFYDSTGAHPVSDTGVLNPGETFSVTLKVSAPSTAIAGDGTDIRLRASAVGIPDLYRDVWVSTAIPAPFVITSRENISIYSELISPYTWYTVDSGYAFNGGSFGVGQAPDQRFISLLHNSNNAYISYMIFDSVGMQVYGDYRLLPKDLDESDSQPASALTPNNRIGLAWLREQFNDFEYRINVMFQMLDGKGDPVLTEPINLTNSSYDSGRTFRSVRIAAAPNNRFVIVWQENRETGNTRDIGWAIYNANTGILTKGLLYPWAVDAIDYERPGLVIYQDAQNKARALIVFNKFDGQMWNVVADILKLEDGLDGVKEAASQLLFSGKAAGFDGVQLQDDGKHLALLWTDLETGDLRLQILNLDFSVAQDLTLAQPTLDIDGRAPVNGSVTKDDQGNAIVTWNDSKRQRLYYILADAEHGLRHQPIIYRSISTSVGLETSDLTQGNAPCSPWWRLFLPLVRK